MSEVAAAAPAPVAPSAPANGVPSGAPNGAPQSAAPSNGAPTRGPDGKFVANGGAAPVNGSAPQTPAEKAEEQFFLNEKLKLFGKEKEARYKTKEDLLRDLQRGAAAIERQKPLQEQAERAAKLLQLAKDKGTLQDFLREAGHDPVEFARELLSGQARKAAMTPEEAELEDLRAFKADQDKAKLTAAEQEKKAEEAKFAEGQAAQAKATVFEALKHTGLPQTYETIYELAHTLRIARSKEGVDYSPEELAKETERRLDGYTTRYVNGLDGAALVKRLGPEVVKRILEARVAQFEEESRAGVGRPTSAPSAPEQPSGPREYLSEADVNQRLRDIKNGK